MKNYENCINKEIIGNDGFTIAGYSDGYSGLGDDSANILFQLHNKCSKEKLIKYITDYLSGYKVGKFMSENSPEIYDEKGELRETFFLEKCASCKLSAEELVMSYK